MTKIFWLDRKIFWENSPGLRLILYLRSNQEHSFLIESLIKETIQFQYGFNLVQSKTGDLKCRVSQGEYFDSPPLPEEKIWIGGEYI